MGMQGTVSENELFMADSPNVVIILADDMGYGDLNGLTTLPKIPEIIFLPWGK